MQHKKGKIAAEFYFNSSKRKVKKERNARTGRDSMYRLFVFLALVVALTVRDNKRYVNGRGMNFE